jgi:glycosyltransferase involved in cell wall biosynthesis
MSGEQSVQRVRRVLVIAYYFPPCGGGGVQRIAKFVRYLPEFGWVPTVLTIAASYYGSRNIDISHISDFPNDVKIIRTPKTDPVAQPVRASIAADGIKSFQSRWSRPPGWLKKLRLLTRSRRGRSPRFHPKGAILWCLRTVAAGLRLHRRERFDLILATGEPYSDFLVAWMLSRLTGVPFVLDMRDPWTLDPYEEAPRSGWRQVIESWQERRMLRACRACIFANSSMDSYAKIFPDWKHKFYYLPNGYDSADLDVVEAKRFDKFTIVHNGNFLPGYRTADTFLLALRDFLNGSPHLRSRMQVLLVGRIGQEEAVVRDLALEDVVQQLGHLPHRNSIEYLKGADLLLLVGGRHRWEETAKVYEYLATGKPILALLQPDGAAAELLRRYSTARVVDRESVVEASAALADAVANGLIARPAPNAAQAATTKQWERKQLTMQLATILETSL